MLRWVLIGACLSAGPSPAAGLVERACLAARADQPALCACTQATADMKLSAPDQKTAAAMIAEPDLYYDWAESKRASRAAFIERYDSWGKAVAELCALEG